MHSQRKHKRWLQITAAVLACLFPLSETAFTQGAFSGAAGEAAQSVEIRPAEFSLPAELGEISQLSLSSREDAPFIIAVQNAHGVISAQENIRSIVSYLHERYGLDLVLVEGASGPLDPLLLATFPDAAVRRQVLKGYLDRSEITGAELAALEIENAEFQGLEDWRIYEANYLAFLQASAERKKAAEILAQLERKLQARRLQDYTAGMQQLHALRESFRGEKITLLDFMHSLRRIEDSSAQLFIEEYLKHSQPLRVLFNAASGALSDADYSRELDRVIQHFEQTSAAALSAEQRRSWNGLLQSYRTEEIAAADFLSGLQRLAGGTGMPLSLPSALRRLELQNETISMIRGAQFMRDLEDLLNGLEDLLTESRVSDELLDLDRRFVFLRDLANLQLTRDQFNAYLQAPDRYLALAGSDRSVFYPALEFYRTAGERDRIFMQKTIETMKKRKARAAVVVTGGFHQMDSDALPDSEGMNVAVVTPAVSSLAGHENYEAVMDGDVSYADYYEDTYYNAFMRHAVRQLMALVPQPEQGRTLKLWRDEIIRALSKRNRLTDIKRYMHFIEELQVSSSREIQAAEFESALRGETESFSRAAIEKLWNEFENNLAAFTARLIREKPADAAALSRLLSDVPAGRSVLESALVIAPGNRLFDWKQRGEIPAFDARLIEQIPLAPGNVMGEALIRLAAQAQGTPVSAPLAQTTAQLQSAARQAETLLKTDETRPLIETDAVRAAQGLQAVVTPESARQIVQSEGFQAIAGRDPLVTAPDALRIDRAIQNAERAAGEALDAADDLRRIRRRYYGGTSEEPRSDQQRSEQRDSVPENFTDLFQDEDQASEVLQMLTGSGDPARIENFKQAGYVESERDGAIRITRTFTFKLEGQPHRFFVNEYEVINTALRALYRSRIAREFRANQAASVYGIAPVTALVEADGIPRHVQKEAGGTPFIHYREDLQAVESIGLSLGKLHGLGIVHRDLAAGGRVLRSHNIFSRADKTVAFIDFEFSKIEDVSGDDFDTERLMLERALFAWLDSAHAGELPLSLRHHMDAVEFAYTFEDGLRTFREAYLRGFSETAAQSQADLPAFEEMRRRVDESGRQRFELRTGSAETPEDLSLTIGLELEALFKRLNRYGYDYFWNYFVPLLSSSFSNQRLIRNVMGQADQFDVLLFDLDNADTARDFLRLAEAVRTEPHQFAYNLNRIYDFVAAHASAEVRRFLDQPDSRRLILAPVLERLRLKDAQIPPEAYFYETRSRIRGQGAFKELHHFRHPEHSLKLAAVIPNRSVHPALIVDAEALAGSYSLMESLNPLGERKDLPFTLQVEFDEEEDEAVVFDQLFPPGKTLREAMSLVQRWQPEQKILLARSIAETLAYVHSKNIIHRDIKEDNVYIPAPLLKNREPFVEQLKETPPIVFDFNISMMLNAAGNAGGNDFFQRQFAEESQDRTTVGTMNFLPFRAAVQSDPFLHDFRRDFFAFGVTVAHLFGFYFDIWEFHQDANGFSPFFLRVNNSNQPEEIRNFLIDLLGDIYNQAQQSLDKGEDPVPFNYTWEDVIARLDSAYAQVTDPEYRSEQRINTNEAFNRSVEQVALNISSISGLDVSKDKFLEWIARQPLIDLGAGKYYPLIRMLRNQYNAQDAYALDPEILAGGENGLSSQRFQDSWLPDDPAKTFRVILSFFALKGEETRRQSPGLYSDADLSRDYRAMAEEMDRRLTADGLALLYVGPQRNAALEEALSNQGFLVSKALQGEPLLIVAKKSMREIYLKIADEVRSEQRSADAGFTVPVLESSYAFRPNFRGVTQFLQDTLDWMMNNLDMLEKDRQILSRYRSALDFAYGTDSPGAAPLAKSSDEDHSGWYLLVQSELLAEVIEKFRTMARSDPQGASRLFLAVIGSGLFREAHGLHLAEAVNSRMRNFSDEATAMIPALGSELNIAGLFNYLITPGLPLPALNAAPLAPYEKQIRAHVAFNLSLEIYETLAQRRFIETLSEQALYEPENFDALARRLGDTDLVANTAHHIEPGYDAGRHISRNLLIFLRKPLMYLASTRQIPKHSLHYFLYLLLENAKSGYDLELFRASLTSYETAESLASDFKAPEDLYRDVEANLRGFETELQNYAPAGPPTKPALYRLKEAISGKNAYEIYEIVNRYPGWGGIVMNEDMMSLSYTAEDNTMNQKMVNPVSNPESVTAFIEEAIARSEQRVRQPAAVLGRREIVAMNLAFNEAMKRPDAPQVDFLSKRIEYLHFITLFETESDLLEAQIRNISGFLEEHMRDYESYKGNIIFTTPADYSAAESRRRETVNVHALNMIEAMVLQRDQIAGRTVYDFGAGDGILSAVALALGAASVQVFERDKKLVEKADVLLGASGWSRGADYHLHALDFVKDAAAFHQIVRSKNQESAVIANIGPWYPALPGAGVTVNDLVISLLPLFPDLRFLVNGGYMLPNHWADVERTAAYIERTLSPARLSFKKLIVEKNADEKLEKGALAIAALLPAAADRNEMRTDFGMRMEDGVLELSRRVSELAGARAANEPVLIAVDGDFGSGKSSFASRFESENVLVIHADDFRDNTQRWEIRWTELTAHLKKQLERKSYSAVIIEGARIFRNKNPDDFDLRVRIHADYDSKFSNLIDRETKRQVRQGVEDINYGYLDSVALDSIGDYAETVYDLQLDNRYEEYGGQGRLPASAKIDLLTYWQKPDFVQPEIFVPVREALPRLKNLITAKAAEKTGAGPVVVGIDGDWGVGKTTLTSQMDIRPDEVIVIHGDPYATGGKLDVEKIEADIRAASEGKNIRLVIIERYLLFHDYPAERFDLKIRISADHETKVSNLLDREVLQRRGSAAPRDYLAVYAMAENSQTNYPFYQGLEYDLKIENSNTFRAQGGQNRLALTDRIDLLGDSEEIITRQEMRAADDRPSYNAKPLTAGTQPVDVFNESILLYPKELLHHRDLEPYLDEFDREHYEFVPNQPDSDTGYWVSKDFAESKTRSRDIGFPGLVLGSWEDIEASVNYTDGRYPDVAMRRHVVIRYRKPGGGTTSHYYFDNHGYSLPYALEAIERGELPASGNTQVFVDDHQDVHRMLTQDVSETLAGWTQLLQDERLNLANFNTFLAHLNVIDRHLWIFDGDAAVYTKYRKPGAVHDFEPLLGRVPYIGLDYRAYSGYENRARSDQSVILNWDTDFTWNMTGQGQHIEKGDGVRRPVSDVLDIHRDLLIGLRRDGIVPNTFHGSTTTYIGTQYGDVELARYLARITPYILLNAQTDEQTIRQAVDALKAEHEEKVFVRSEQRVAPPLAGGDTYGLKEWIAPDLALADQVVIDLDEAGGVRNAVSVWRARADVRRMKLKTQLDALLERVVLQALARRSEFRSTNILLNDNSFFSADALALKLRAFPYALDTEALSRNLRNRSRKLLESGRTSVRGESLSADFSRFKTEAIAFLLHPANRDLLKQAYFEKTGRTIELKNPSAVMMDAFFLSGSTTTQSRGFLERMLQAGDFMLAYLATTETSDYLKPVFRTPRLLKKRYDQNRPLEVGGVLAGGDVLHLLLEAVPLEDLSPGKAKKGVVMSETLFLSSRLGADEILPLTELALEVEYLREQLEAAPGQLFPRMTENALQSVFDFLSELADTEAVRQAMLASA